MRVRIVAADVAVLCALGRGLHLFGLPAGARIPAPGWQHRVTHDPLEALHLARHGNIGVSCRASDVVVFDLDRHPGHPDGLESFMAACESAGTTPPDTFAVRTPNGLHLYFAAGGRPIPSTSGGRTALGPGIDTRGPGRRQGGYVLAPGSRTAAGEYHLLRNIPVTPLPDWIAHAIHPEGAP